MGNNENPWRPISERPEKDDEYLVAWHPKKDIWSEACFVAMLEFSMKEGWVGDIEIAKSYGGFELIGWTEIPDPRLAEEVA